MNYKATIPAPNKVREYHTPRMMATTALHNTNDDAMILQEVKEIIDCHLKIQRMKHSKYPLNITAQKTNSLQKKYAIGNITWGR